MGYCREENISVNLAKNAMAFKMTLVPDLIGKLQALDDRQMSRDSEGGRTLHHVLAHDSTVTFAKNCIHLPQNFAFHLKRSQKSFDSYSRRKTEDCHRAFYTRSFKRNRVLELHQILKTKWNSNKV